MKKSLLVLLVMLLALNLYYFYIINNQNSIINQAINTKIENDAKNIIEKANTIALQEQLHYKSMKNKKINTVFIRTKQSEPDNLEDYTLPLIKWANNNKDKTIISISNYPAQGGVYGLFVTYKSEPTNQKYVVKGYKNNLRSNDNSKKINFVKSIMSNKEIVTTTTINGWRGGVRFVINVEIAK